MPVVSNAVVDPGGTPVRVVVTVRLIAGETGYEPGYTDDGVVAGIVRVTSDDDGEWSVTLPSNADITPANSYYEVLERIPGRSVAYQHYISVPDGAGPYELPAILVDEPDSPDELAIAASQKGAANGVATLDSAGQVPANQLGNASGTSLASTSPTTSAVGEAAAVGVGTTAARADHRHGRESFGVVTAQTTYGASSGNGSAATVARADHAHGTPALPTAADVGAATTGHDHSGTYQPLDADLTAIAALSPSNDDLVQRKAGAWTNRTPAQVKTDLAIAVADVSGLQTALDAKATKIVVRSARLTAGDITMPSTAGAWALQSGTTLSIPAAVGDYVEFTWLMMWATSGNNFLDWATVVSSAIARALSSDTSTPLTEGSPAMYKSGFEKASGGPWGFVVASGDLSGGTVTFQLAAKGTGTGTVYRSSTYPMLLRAKNFGPCDVA